MTTRRRTEFFKKALTLPLVLSLCACAKSPVDLLTALTKSTPDYFATVSTLIVYDDFSADGASERLDKLWSEIEQTLAKIDAAVSPRVPDSDISRFNALSAGQSADVSPITAEIFRLARDAYDRTNGLFDPSVYNLTDLWGLTPRFDDYNYAPSEAYDRERQGTGFPSPDEEYLAAFLTLTDFSSIELIEINGEFLLKKPDKSVVIGGVRYTARIDLGGIAKGYAVDRVSGILEQYGYEYGYFSCGTSSMSVLERPAANEGSLDERRWSVGIVNPRPEFADERTFFKAFVKNTGLSTSGDYENYYFTSGVRYSHIIDPRTGRPAGVTDAGEKICSVTLFGGTAAMDDALTTVLCLMPPGQAEEFLAEISQDGLYYVIASYRDGAERINVRTNLPDGGYELIFGDLTSPAS